MWSLWSLWSGPALLIPDLGLSDLTNLNRPAPPFARGIAPQSAPTLEDPSASLRGETRTPDMENLYLIGVKFVQISGSSVRVLKRMWVGRMMTQMQSKKIQLE